MKGCTDSLGGRIRKECCLQEDMAKDDDGRTLK